MVPKVTVVMPCYNEERFIGRAIESLVGFVRSEPTEKNEINGVRPYFWNIEADDYFRENCELILVDGMSSDRTKEVILTFIEGNEAKKLGLQREGQIKLLENKERTQSHGLNLGIKEARGEIIVRADAHCIFPPGYVRRCVELLEATGAANVGGVMVPVTDGPNANSGLGSDAGQGGSGSWSEGSGQEVIALALRHPAGVGDARWHLGNYTGFVDTVYLGMFYRKLFDEIGLFDPKASPNEDGELNLRILKAGKRIYLDSSIRVVYFPRETLRKLAKQYFHYGRGRCYTTLKHRRVTSWRQVGPVVLVGGLGGALVMSLWMPVFLLVPAAYVVMLVGLALRSRFPDAHFRFIEGNEAILPLHKKNATPAKFPRRLLRFEKWGQAPSRERVPGTDFTFARNDINKNNNMKKNNAIKENHGMQGKSDIRSNDIKSNTHDIGRNSDEATASVPVRLRLLVAVAWAVMHVSWGAGFIYHFVRRK